MELQSGSRPRQLRYQAPLDHELDLRVAIWQGQALRWRLESGCGQVDRWMADRWHSVLPHRIAPGTLANPTPDHWFDLTAFRPTTDNTGTYGNSGRDILRNPGQSQADLSLVKNTRFRDRFEHQLKLEFFNAFNHPQFSGPGSSIGAATASVISSLLYNTPMRQIQIAMKLSF